MVIGCMNKRKERIYFVLEDRKEYLARFNFFLKSEIVLLSCDILNRILQDIHRKFSNSVIEIFVPRTP